MWTCTQISEQMASVRHHGGRKLEVLRLHTGDKEQDEKQLSSEKNFAPLAVALTVFSPAELKMSTYSTIYPAFFDIVISYGKSGRTRDQSEILIEKSNTANAMERMRLCPPN